VPNWLIVFLILVERWGRNLATNRLLFATVKTLTLHNSLFNNAVQAYTLKPRRETHRRMDNERRSEEPGRLLDAVHGQP